jgi:hypothetical protein
LLALLLAVNLARFTSLHGVVLEKTSLDGAARIFGPAEIRHNGLDAGGSVYNSCYLGPDGTILVFSSSEMGGPEHDTTNFQIVAKPGLVDYGDEGDSRVSEEHKPHCAQSALVSRTALIGGQLHLGMTARAATKILGGALRDGRLIIRAETPRKKGFVTDRGVEIFFERGRAVAIRVYQVTSS